MSLTVVDTPLLGAPFTHLDLSDATKSLYLGCTSAWKDPDRYSSSILSLFEHYRQHILPKGIPLVVNSAGWVKSMGFDILSHVISEMKPAYVICLQSEPAGMAGTLSSALEGLLADTPKALQVIESISAES